MRTPLLLMIFLIALMVESAFGATNVVQSSDSAVPGCPLVLGDASLKTTITRSDSALLVKTEPVRYGSCSRFKALRLITPEGKRLKPKKIRPRHSGGASISIGIGHSSGGGTGASVFVHGPSGGYSGSNRITYVFERGLPEGALGSDWIWAIKTFDRCTKTKQELHIPVDQLVSCEAN